MFEKHEKTAIKGENTMKYLLGMTLFVVVFGFSACPIVAEEPPRFSILETKVITPADGYYYGWPSVAVDQNDQLLVVVSGGREEHVCPFGRVDLLRSRDAGETWTWPQTLIDGPIDDRDAGILVTPKGTIIVTTFTSLAYWDYSLKKAQEAAKSGNPIWDNAQLARWLAVHDRVSEAERQKELGTWVIRSTDNGLTWEARMRTPVNSPHGPIALNDGRLLYVGKKLWDTPATNGVAESFDDGKTWTWLAELPVRDGDSPEDYHEYHAVQTTGGRIIAQIRNHNKANDQETLQCESEDGGKTWTTPHTIGVWGHPSHLLRLRDNRILMTYGHRRDPLGNQARISSDEGKTWSAPMIISGDGTSGDLGYPSTVQLQDGTLVTVWYEKMEEFPKSVLRMAKWRLLE